MIAPTVYSTPPDTMRAMTLAEARETNCGAAVRLARLRQRHRSHRVRRRAVHRRRDHLRAAQAQSRAAGVRLPRDLAHDGRRGERVPLLRDQAIATAMT